MGQLPPGNSSLLFMLGGEIIEGDQARSSSAVNEEFGP
jgi:hypothetical protein